MWGAPPAPTLAIERATRGLRVGRSLPHRFAREYESSSRRFGISMIRFGGCLRVPRLPLLLEVALIGRVVRLCDAAIPAEVVHAV